MIVQRIQAAVTGVHPGVRLGDIMKARIIDDIDLMLSFYGDPGRVETVKTVVIPPFAWLDSRCEPYGGRVEGTLIISLDRCGRRDPLLAALGLLKQ
jgi:hypothetical protein